MKELMVSDPSRGLSLINYDNEESYEPIYMDGFPTPLGD